MKKQIIKGHIDVDAPDGDRLYAISELATAVKQLAYALQTGTQVTIQDCIITPAKNNVAITIGMKEKERELRNWEFWNIRSRI